MKTDENNAMKYIKEIGRRLKNPNMFGAASLMIGAGFSKNAIRLNDDKKQMPNWSELAEEMYDELFPGEEKSKNKIEECAGRNMLTLAQKYEVAFDKKTLNNFIEREIDDKSYRPGELHRKILELNWNDIFTTNYDTLLERGIELAATKWSYRIIQTQEDLPGSVRPRIVKLHGSVGNSDNYIITEEDYRTYPYNYAPFVNTVQQSMLETRLCLLGFSGTDPNFLSWLGWLRDNMGKECPSIFLFGVFEDMKESERKMLENRNIKIVDLTELAPSDSQNKQYDAINRLLDILKDESCSKKSSVIQNAPYRDLLFLDRKSEEWLINYANNMKQIVEEISDNIENYICLPEKERLGISNYINNQLRFIVNQKSFTNKKLLVGKFCSILQKCNYPLFDDLAEKLEKMIKEDFDSESIKMQISLYLLQMYRLDGNVDGYSKVCEACEKNISKTNIINENNYYIDKCKYYISILDLNSAKEMATSIDESSDTTCALKKASLLNQLGLEEDAKKILMNVVADIAQQKYEDDKKASLLGFINLIYRDMNCFLKNKDLFSDIEYENNEYNCRDILNKSKDHLQNILFEKDGKEKETNNSFNPNTYNSKVTIGNSDKKERVLASFDYLLLQDLLCVGIYSNHRRAIVESISEINKTSQSPLWKWYMLVKTNDVRIYERIFKRETINSSDKEYVKLLFDRIIMMVDYYLKDVEKNYPYPFKVEALIDILSRLSVVLDEQRIMTVISIIYQLNEKQLINNPSYENIIKISLDRMKYSFNKRILISCLKYIKDNSLAAYGFSNCFIGLKVNKNDIVESKLLDDTIESVATGLKAKEENGRNNSVVKYKLFEDIIKDSHFEKNVHDNLWGQTDEYGFPLNSIYLPIVWGDEPIFDSSIKKYLLNPNIDRKIIADGVISENKSFYKIQNYYITLFKTIHHYENSKFLTEKELSSIVQYFIDYIDEEKSLLNEDEFFLFGRKKAIDGFALINDIVFILCVNAKVNNIYGNVFKNSIQKYVEQNSRLDLGLGAVQLIVHSLDLVDDFDIVERKIKSGENSNIDSLLITLYGLQEMSNTTEKKEDVDKKILEFISNIEYLDIETCKKVLSQIMVLVRKPLFLQDENREEFVDILIKCFNRFMKSKYKNDKIGTDGMYNVSVAAKIYYDYLDEKNVEKGEKFNNLIDLLKASKLNEVRKEWVEVLD